MIFLAVYHRKRRKTSRGEVERRALICYTKADESEAIMKKIKYMAVVLATGLLLAGCEEDETQNNKDAYRQIGINCMQEGDYEGAIDAFQNALDQSLAVVGEEEIDTCYYKAAAQYAAGKKEDAIETYQALINYDKKNAQAYFLLGELYRKENDMDKAKENFNLMKKNIEEQLDKKATIIDINPITYSNESTVGYEKLENDYDLEI